MRTSKCTCLIFGVSIGLTLARNVLKKFLIGQSSRSHATYRRPSLDGFQFASLMYSSVRICSFTKHSWCCQTWNCSSTWNYGQNWCKC